MRLLTPLYAGVTSMRRRLYQRGTLRSVRVDAPVAVVGNLTAGGAGKTPLTIALVEELQRAGRKPGVASRGYGRRDEKSPRWVDADTAAQDGGDEPVLIARRTGAPVRVDRDRAAAAQALVEAGCDIVVCDDGLQHYRLARDIEIEVIDGQRRYGNGLLLPAGPMREPPARALRCDFHVLNLGQAGDAEVAMPDPAADAQMVEWPMRLRMDHAVPMAEAGGFPLRQFSGCRVHAVAGIGNPERFFSMLRNLDIAVVPHAFADHHVYSAGDLRFGSPLPILMTEKDAVKCAGLVGAHCFSVPITAELPAPFWAACFDRLHDL
jgi:tetraacyldisaccharide 4'-kinase